MQELDHLLGIATRSGTDQGRLALQMSKKAWGKAQPNPMVGCIILDAEGNLVGEWKGRVDAKEVRAAVEAQLPG